MIQTHSGVKNNQTSNSKESGNRIVMLPLIRIGNVKGMRSGLKGKDDFFFGGMATVRCLQNFHSFI